MLKQSHRILCLCVLAILLYAPKFASADVFAEFEVPGTRSAYRTDPNVNTRRTDHFLIRFGPKPRQGFMVEQMYQGQMQFLENVYETWQILGLHPLGGSDPTTKYKLVIEPAQTWDGDTPGTAVGFGEGPTPGGGWVPGIHIPCNSLAYKAPNGCTPHECGHGWQNQGGGLPSVQPPGLTESLANWVMQQQLVGYPQDMIAVGMPYGHAATSYNCMSIFNHFMYAPGYGVEFINKLIFDPNLNTWNNVLADDIIRKAIRVDTSGAVDKAGAIHDELGKMNAKMLDMDFWNHRVNHAYAYDTDTSWAVQINGMWQGFQFNRIAMVKQPGVSGTWYRPDWTCIPQLLSNNYIPLNITATGSLKTVTCDFRPVADAVRGTSFRACFVAFNRNKEPRYGKVWNVGVNSFTIADDENAVYLAIIACPKTLNAAMVHSDYTLDNVAMFPYRISLTGATPKGWQWPVPTSGFHLHSNGGGKVANTATVDATAYVGPNAMVLGTAKVYGYSRIEDYAAVDSGAVIGRSGQTDNPVISGHAYVSGYNEWGSSLNGSPQVYGHAKIRDYAWVWGNANIYDNAIVMAHSMINGAQIYGNAVMNQAPLRDPGLNYNGVYSGSAIVGGDCSSLGVMASDRGVWCEYPAISVADNQYQYLGYNFEKTSCVFAMDQYGMNHSYLMGEPQVVSDSINGVTTNVLELNGAQYVELRPDAVDFADITISAWVKCSGMVEDQKIFSCGDGASKYMSLTPFDGNSGKLRFAISNGTATQYLDGAAALPANTWTHIAITLAGNTGTLYVNGLQVAQNTSLTIDPDQLHATLMEDANYIGRGNSGNYFSGRIDEFKVYNKALSAAEVLALKGVVVAGTAAAADTAAPAPATSTWLVAPVLASKNAITMSATEGTDAGGNGVLYYFRCVNDSAHDSGWISENKYTDCNCAVGATYTYAVKMKDKKGNTGIESSQLSATNAGVDTTAPTPNPPTFAVAPKGTGTTSISMTATKGIDTDELVMYRFNRVIPYMGTVLASSGWTSSRTWTDTSVTAGTSNSYNFQMMDGRGNITSNAVAASAVARDDTPPALDTDFRLQWDTYPYTQLDKTVRMYARPQAETAVDYYYECVQVPSINSGWMTTSTWVTPAMPDGIYSFRFKLRDRSPQLNQTAWSTPKSSKILTTNTYHDYTLTQLSGLPDSTLVRFSGKVTAVAPAYYTVSTPDGLTSIKVVPRTFGNQADATLLNQNVNVKGHLWTFNSDPKQVTGAIVTGSPQVGKIEFENCDYDEDLARLLYDFNTSGSEYIGWCQDGWSVTIPNVGACTQFTIGYAGQGNLSLYLNGTHYKDLVFPSTGNGSTWGSTSFTGLNIPAGATLKIQRDTGDWDVNLDYMIFGSAYSISGKVTDTNGVGIAGADVYFSGGPNAALNPTYSTKTDASGNYTKTVPDGTWYVAAAAASLAYVTTADQIVTLNGSAKTNINFSMVFITRVFPRSEDMLVSFITDMLPDAGDIRSWMTYLPTGSTYGSGGIPKVETINGTKWEKNERATGDCFRSPEYTAPIAINGATIVIALKPIRTELAGYQWGVVDAFFDRLALGVHNNTGQVRVTRKGVESYSATAIPDGQATILSMVMQPTGQYKVYANGVQIMSVTTTEAMTSLIPSVHNSITIGSNGPDGASTFNGNIGDVAFYKVALTDSERQELEATMSAKFGIQQYALIASAGDGGSISPNGALVTTGTNQTFTITPNVGYAISQVAVDGVNQGAISSYTFANVNANHTISATFAALPDQIITASAGANGSISPSGNVSVQYGANQTFAFTANTGYSIANVIVDGVAVGAVNSYTFSNVTASHTISVTFGPYTGPVPIAFYQFENNVTDTMGTYSGTAFGIPTYVTGKLGTAAIQLNGTNQYVTIPRPVSNSFSIAFWVKTTQSSPTGSQWYNGNGMVDGEVGGGTNDFGVTYMNSKVAFGVGNSDTTYQSTSSINSGNWVHVACTRDSTDGQMKIYVNGTLEKTGTGPVGTKSSPSTLHIGNLQTGGNYFSGTIDQLKIYNVVLTASEVTALASEGNTCTITASAGPNGVISPAGAVSVYYGASQTFTATPNPGYGIADLAVDGVSVSPAITYTFSNVTGPHSISVSFAKPLGMNNRSVLTDAKAHGRLVKLWGKVASVNGVTSFTLSDGYNASGITVRVNGSALPSGFGSGETVVVTGVLTADKSVQAQAISAY